MSSESFKYKVKEKLSESKLMNLFDFFKKGELPLILFFLLINEPIREYLRYPDNIFQTSSISFIFLAVKAVVFFFVFRACITKKYDIYEFWNLLHKNRLNLVVLFFILTLSFSIGGLAIIIPSVPYSIYMCNIAILFFSPYEILDKNKLDDGRNNIKVISLGIHMLSFLIYVLIGKADPLYITNFLAVTPFFIACLFIKVELFSYLAYRILFISLFFFATSMISPYLLILGLLIMWLGKLYYFLKYDIKYPSFYKKYDIR